MEYVGWFMLAAPFVGLVCALSRLFGWLGTAIMFVFVILVAAWSTGAIFLISTGG